MDDLVDSIIKVRSILKKDFFYMKELARGNCRLQFYKNLNLKVSLFCTEFDS
jgi:hypothetical protein